MTIQVSPGLTIYSDNKLIIQFHEKQPEGQWVDITFLQSRVWYPSLIQLAFVLRGIATCEDNKYPYGQGRDLLLQFLWDALNTEMTREELITAYKLPSRVSG